MLAARPNTETRFLGDFGYSEATNKGGGHFYFISLVLFKFVHSLNLGLYVCKNRLEMMERTDTRTNQSVAFSRLLERAITENLLKERRLIGLQLLSRCTDSLISKLDLISF